jgi:valyl-tRNA synthetase
VVEPLLSTQWFLKTQPLAEPALRAVEDGRVRVTPDNYKKIYLDWMYKIYDWCISRQLWWGHRIPAWYCDACGEVIVARQTPVQCGKCAHASLRPDTDTLDTWFSSGLWPFATLGWPDHTADVRRFYPNNLMIMGFDILFFWGARMIMLGLEFMKDVPFRELYIHALVRDAERQKMSKTKGNVLDPLEVTEKYGTDAVRFALAISAAPGTDIAFSVDKVESYRAFANKIWNAGRFILMNLQKMPEAVRSQLGQALEPIPTLGFQPIPAAEHLALADRWIFSRLAAVTLEIEDALQDYRFHEAAFKIYHFFWHEFCDWYVEWVKPEITRPAEGEKVPPAWINLARVFEASLHLLHPFMPFITEELWHLLPHRSAAVSISLTDFRLVTERVADPISEAQLEKIQELVVMVRNAKAEMGLQTQKPSLQVASEDLRLLEIFRTHQDSILRLAALRAMHMTRGRLSLESPDLRSGASFDLRVLHEEKVDHEAERLRLHKEKTKLEQQLAQVRAQLGNQEFVARAPREVVRGAEHRLKGLESHLRKVLESLERLG